MRSKTYSRDVFILSAIYKFCCKGAYCPECPLHLTLHVTGQTLTVTRSLGMSCENHIFNTSVKVTTRPGAYDIQVRKCSRKDEVKIFSSPPIVLPSFKLWTQNLGEVQNRLPHCKFVFLWLPFWTYSFISCLLWSISWTQLVYRFSSEAVSEEKRRTLGTVNIRGKWCNGVQTEYLLLNKKIAN